MGRIGLALGVAALALSSGYANYLHTQHMGLSIIGLVIGAEIVKLFAPLAIMEHARKEHYIPLLAATLLWVIAATFSFTNTFSNALARAANEQARIQRAQEEQTRPINTILIEIASIPACDTIKNRSNREKCAQEAQTKRQVLKTELEISKTTKNTQIIITKGDPIRDGIVLLAAMWQIELPKERVFVIVTLIWTLFAELGSSFGAFAIPRREKVPQN